MKRLTFVLVLILLFSLLVVFPVIASSGHATALQDNPTTTVPIPDNFTSFLALIGSPVFIGVILSLLLVKSSWFAALGSTAKLWLVGLVSICLPIISRALLLYLPMSVVAFIESWWPTLVIGLGVWMSSQVWNKLFGISGAVSKAEPAIPMPAPVVLPEIHTRITIPDAVFPSANQGTFSATPQTTEVKEAKASGIATPPAPPQT